MKKQELKYQIEDLAYELNQAHVQLYDLEVALAILTGITAGLLAALDKIIKRIEDTKAGRGSVLELVLAIDEDARAAMSAFESLAGIPGSDDDQEDCDNCPLKDQCPVANDKRGDQAPGA